MCTAATYKTKDFYFGRTLDYEISYGEQVVVTPRSYPFQFRHMGPLQRHFAMVGIAHVAENCPLYYDGVNEKGLCMAGLNFVGNAVYQKPQPGKENVAQFEFIPWILSQCATVQEARTLLSRMALVDTPFGDGLPVAQLHWIIADKDSCITVESVAAGLKVYDNPVGILTNNPPFREQLFNLNNYIGLSTHEPTNRFCSELDLHTYSRGMGALGLPGDLSSQSRFVRASFVKMNSRSGDSEGESISQLFHILNSVDQPRGCCCMGDGKYEVTLYTGCSNACKGIYYYTSYDNHQITAVDMHKEDLESQGLVCFPLVQGEQINYQN